MKTMSLRQSASNTNFFFCLLILVFTFSYLSGSAQLLGKANPSRKAPFLPKIYAGIKLGANFAHLSGSNWKNQMRSNMVGGVFAGIKGLSFGAQMEGIFEQSEYTTSNNFYDVYKDYYNNLADSAKSGTFRVNKLSLPVLVQFRVARLFWLQAGVQFYGIVAVKDFNGLVKDSKQLFKSGSTAGVIGTSFHFRNADIGARAIIDFQNLNNLYSGDVWKQYMLQAHVGIRLF